MEKKYHSKITIDLDSNTVSIKDCANRAIIFIEDDIKKECNKKCITCYQSDPLPGLNKLFEDQTYKLFLGELNNIKGLFFMRIFNIFLE